MCIKELSPNKFVTKLSQHRSLIFLIDSDRSEYTPKYGRDGTSKIIQSVMCLQCHINTCIPTNNVGIS